MNEHSGRSCARAGGGVLVCAFAFACLMPAAASAACPERARADLRAAAVTIARLQAVGHPLAADMSALHGRARRQCRTAGFVRAAAALTARGGVPAAGQRAGSRGLVLVGAQNSWRLDATGSVRAARGSAVRLQRAIALGRPVGSGLVWGLDPTRPAPEPALQAGVAAQFAAARLPNAPGATRRTLAAFSLPGLRRAAARQPLIPSLATAASIGRSAARVGGVPAVRAVIARAQRRLRGADAGTWAKVSGSWASLAQQRALLRLGTRVVTLQPHPATQRVVRSLRLQLRTKPIMSFRAVPVRAFYPVPQDGVDDTRSTVIAVDKPAVVTVRIFHPGGGVAQTLQGEALPRHPYAARWNGVGTDGQVVPPAQYRYTVFATDRAGNRRWLPGVGAFIVARDTEPPVVRSASVKYLGGSPVRSLRVRWQVTETISPAITTVLVLRGGGEQRKLALPGTAQTGARNVSVRLPAGRYAAYLRFTDASGNVVVRSVGPIRFG